MNEYKCPASIDGICRNVIGIGTPCHGYSKECKLKPTYDKLTQVAENLETSIKRAFGIKGDV